MSHEIEQALTDGLNAGYTGGKPTNVNRAGFDGKSSHIENNRSNYHDEWFVETRVGGGQELVMTNGKKFTRLYAGETPEEQVLDSLGISVKDVGTYLKSKIIELGSKTRLFEDCDQEPDGEWQYTYRVTSNDSLIGVTTGMESIDYRDTTVHIHAFILSPIK